jgi:hypothetical protein
MNRKGAEGEKGREKDGRCTKTFFAFVAFAVTILIFSLNPKNVMYTTSVQPPFHCFPVKPQY